MFSGAPACRPVRQETRATRADPVCAQYAVTNPPNSPKGGPVSEWRVYPANRDACARLTEVQSAHYGRVHRLDPINANIPAKLGS
jgi:hypothetical protein